MRQKTNRPDSIGKADQHHASLRQFFSAIDRDRSSSAVEPAAINPDQHREAIGRFLGRSPDIEIEAFFTHRRRLLPVRWRTEAPLHALWRKLIGETNTIPVRRRLWRM